ncbi:MAG: PH domain-containing protein [Deltaproteobacteria bacterium]|nr:PH domain-containing protein [Deltaproteobacteria bacterium]
MQSPSDVFVSKRDGWLVAVIWIASAVGLAALLPALWVSQREPLGFWVVLATILALGLGPWVLYSTRYAIEASELRIVSGPFRWRVPFAEIRSVEPSTNPLSSPACSLDRLLIQYGKRRIMISPLDRAGFLRALAARCPQLRTDGECLRPA